MPIRVVTEVGQALSLLDDRISRDPVRATVLGTIRAGPVMPHPRGWCAISTRSDGLAVRSDPGHPVQLHGNWGADPSGLMALAGLLRDLPDLVGLAGPVDLVDRLTTGLPESDERVRLRLFRLDHLRPPTEVPGRPRRAETRDRSRVLEWYRAFEAEAAANVTDIDSVVDAAIAGRGCWLWEHGGRVTALASRRPVVAGSARIGPVYTPPPDRGRGYGSAVTAAATRDVLDDAAIPVLFTDLSNPTSNGIYRRLGYLPVEDRLEIRWR